MATPEWIIQQVTSLTADLISSGLCVDQNFPSLRTEPEGEVLVGFSAPSDLSITLKNIPYADAYSVIKEQRSYNMRLIDGGLVQLLYRFQGNELQKHRLAFFPSPDLLEYQNNSEVYEQDELYGDVIMKNVVTTPLRFDFDRGAFIEGDHPMSHLTIGQYKNCRIPVSAPLTPYYFMNFILRAFYNTPFRKFCTDLRVDNTRFERTIARRELEQVYVQACLTAI